MTIQDVLTLADTHILPAAVERYGLRGYAIRPVPTHEGGRNAVFTCEKAGAPSRILRIVFLSDRSLEALLAEAEYIRYLRTNGASVADVIPSNRGNLIEEIFLEGRILYASLFERAKGRMLAENNFQYREGAPIEEYYFNCGKTLGKLHQLSKAYQPRHRRHDFFDKYNPRHIERLVPPSLPLLKERLYALLEDLAALPRDRDSYGMIHLDYGDGNYNIDFETGQITVYDFDNACFGWYLYDLADLWRNGVGWFQFEREPAKRRQSMDAYFATALAGYRSQTALDEEALRFLPLLIKATEMEGILDAFECAQVLGEAPECDEELTYRIRCIEEDIPYEGFFHEIYSHKTPFQLAPREI